MQFLGGKEIQRFLNTKGHALKVDGIIGPLSRRALCEVLKANEISHNSWYISRCLIAIQQYIMKSVGIDPGAIDGLMGPNTRYAIERWQNKQRVVPNASNRSNTWPSDSDAREFYGAPGTNLDLLKLPYPMVLAWDPSTVVTRFAINRKCKDSAHRVLTKVRDHYGIPGIKNLGLHLFAGCYNNRPKRGSKSKSTHAYGAAIDFDSEHNQFRWHSDRAVFARPEYDAWWGFWEEEGWISLGRERNYDWMHVQAVNL